MSLTSDMAVIDDAMLEALGDDVDFNGEEVRVIFMTGLQEAAAGQNVVEALLHECWCRKSALPEIAVDDPVTFTNPETDEVLNFRFLAQDPPDESGFCRVRLGSA